MPNLPISLRRQVRNFADAVAKSSKTPITNAPTNKVVWGVVSSIQTGPPQSLTLTLAGSSTTVAGIRYLSSYSPTVGDTVVCSKYGTDLVVLGGMSGVTHATTIRIPQTYAVLGTLVAESLPIFYVPVPSGQSVHLIGIRAKVATATSVNIDVQQNGAGVTGLTSLTITTTSTSHTLSSALSLANNDEMGVVINSASGSPSVLSCTFFLSVMS